MTYRLVLFYFLISYSACAQQIERIGEEPPFAFSGSVGFDQVFYAGNRAINDRDPYTYIMSGSLTTSIYGWSIPISFTLSNYNTTFLQPFNQFGIRPAYKNLKLYLGYSSMSFNPYSLNGHIFLGGGAEYRSSSGLVAALMVGRLRQAVEEDSVAATQAGFRRMGMGMQLGYENNGDRIIGSVFSAYDDPNSIQISDSSELLPQQNFVFSLEGSKKLFDRFFLDLNIARSTVTRDVTLPGTEGSRYLWTGNESTASFNAIKGEGRYSYSSGTIALAYERIDPGFQTLGAYYFNKDLENITLNFSQRLAPLSISGRIGVQRNNLDGRQLSNMKRMVGSLSLAYTSSGGANIQAQYSTFNTFTNIRPAFADLDQLSPYDNFDTLNYRQVNNSASLNLAIPMAHGEGSSHSLNANLLYQGSRELLGAESSLDFYNMVVSYMIGNPMQSISLMWITNISSTAMNSTIRLGPTVSLSQYFLEKKLRSIISGNFSRSNSSVAADSDVWLVRSINQLKLADAHRISLNMILRGSRRESVSSLDFTTNVAYNYSF